MGINGKFVFSQVLLDCLLRLTYNERDRAELIQCCKNEHNDNDAELRNIRDFEQQYTSDKALRWYTRDAFFYKFLNAVLRKQNFHMMFLFRGFIADIQQQLQKHQCNQMLKVFRGQMMSKEELERLKQSIGKLISINSFFSTTTNHAKVFSFLNSSLGLERILFEINADPKMATAKPFANISMYSDYPGESEVLFMIGSIFRVESIRSNDTKIWIIRMSLCSDEEHDLKQVLFYMKAQIGDGETNLRTLGRFLWKMGNFDLAEKYFLRLLDELESDDPLRSTLYEDLGELAALRGDYDMSIQYQQKSLRLKNDKQMNERNSLPISSSNSSKHTKA